MLKTIEPDKALEIVLEHARPNASQQCALLRATGMTLGETVTADRDFPPFDRAMMDGYAVHADDAGHTIKIVSEVAAGTASSVVVEPSTCVSIMTGAPCPVGANAVVKIEDTSRIDDQVVLPVTINEGQHIARRGCECPSGEVVLRKGEIITPLSIAVLASVGKQSVCVARPSHVAIITTGNELVTHTSSPNNAQIRDSNGPMLAAQVDRTGVCDPPLVLHAKDTLDSLKATLERAASADIILLSGGVSMGRFDLVPKAVEDGGLQLVFHKVTQKPGKPLLFGHRQEQLIFGLPGNPLSAHMCFHRYVAPALRKMAGRNPWEPFREGKLTADLKTTGGRTKFLLAKAVEDGPFWMVTPLVGKGSADIFAAPTANAYVRVKPGLQSLKEGESIDFQWIGERW